MARRLKKGLKINYYPINLHEINVIKGQNIPLNLLLFFTGLGLPLFINFIYILMSLKREDYSPSLGIFLFIELSISSICILSGIVFLVIFILRYQKNKNLIFEIIDREPVEYMPKF